MLLKKGDNNENVKLMQEKLGISPAVTNFGPKTEAAVKEFQAKHGLPADGIVGDKTWAMIMGEKIAALRSVGEVDGVDAFKKKTEVVHKMETMEEVEKELLSMLSELKAKALLKPKSETIDAEIVEDDGNETEIHDN